MIDPKTKQFIAMRYWLLGRNYNEHADLKLMTDKYTKQFIAMRYWLLGRSYYLALDALEYAAQLLISQIELLRAVHKAQESSDLVRQAAG